MADPKPESLVATMERMAAHEAPYIVELRRICEEIGYGRVIQLAERWMDEKHPGWLAAKRSVMAREHRQEVRRASKA